MSNEKKQIEFSDNQLLIMREALEFYSRFLSGQVESLPDVLRWNIKNREAADKALREFKAAAFPELHPNESYGVGAPRGYVIKLHRQVSYEMYRQIYVYQTRKRKLAGDDVSMNVYNGATMRYSDEDLIEIVEKED